MGNKTAKLSPKTVEKLQHHMDVDFTSQEIKDWYVEFQQSLTPGNTQLSRDDFIRVYHKMFCGDAACAAFFAEQVFRTFDKNGNGYVDFKEFIVGMSISSSPDNDKKWEWAFNVYDADGDGFISRSEMFHIIQASFLMTQTPLPAKYETIDDLVDYVFTSLDSDEDKLISKDEFVSGARQLPFIVDVLECDPDYNE